MTSEGNSMDIWQDAVNKRLDGHDVLIQQIRDQQLLDGHDIKNLKEDIKEIKDDTKWTRRAITNAFIVGIIGGAVALIYTVLQS
ncbi:hemolysin XhlA family protein [Psychrobacillus sp. FJAT-21963]|uniref:hemolysin XhlA family protein n=1 Tax=Psychrobacillus sp. FJAT-21963 TaxID=1712028 RepID=UPI0006F5170F|nr:hemolysin XhlA family protein [Psychrobacillus sp. FJAT-21963]KQL37114.1 hypothetical protein AN959_03480 [Psychrobacillus sp. FJAT-21963]